MNMKKKKRSLRFKLMFAFIFTSILPIIIWNLFSYYNTSEILKNNVKELTENNLEQTKTSMDVWLESYEDVLFQISTNDNIVEMTDKINRNEDVSVIRNQLRRTIQGFFYTKEYIKSISILTESGEMIFYDSLTGSTTENSWLDNLGMGTEELYDTVSEDNAVHIFSTKKAKDINREEQYLFHIGRRMIDYRDINKQLGIVIVSIDNDFFDAICNYQDENSNSTKFIVDTQGNLVSYKDENMLGTNIIQWSENAEERKKAYKAFAEKNDIFPGQYSLVYITHDDKTDWDIVQIANQEELMNQLFSQQKLLIVTLLFSITALFWLIFISIKRITSSLSEMVKVMKKTGAGNLEERVVIDAHMPTEVEVIANQFNSMMEKLGQSIEKEKLATKKQRDAEIAALEAQINPHFLYNTLDTINWMAIDKDEFEISNSIGALASILRYGIDNSNSLVTVRQEEEWLKRYLFLQQTRLKNSFACEIHIQPETLECKIHKLLLQPFVENSIIHGFEGVSRKHLLKVEISKVEPEMLEVKIWDNGKGIDRDSVIAMNQGIFGNTTEKNHIGMENAINRIHMYYGEKAQIDIKSEKDSFTEILIRIPAGVIQKKIGEENENHSC